MNLFVLTNNGLRRTLRIPLSSSVQAEIESAFSIQEKEFLSSFEDEIAFDGKYRPDDGECLFIPDYDDIDNIHYAIANPLSIHEISSESNEFNSIKAVFTGRIDAGRTIALVQSFDKRKVISNGGLSIYFSGNVYTKFESVGLTLDNKLAAILDDKKLSFFSFHAVRQIFDLSQYYLVATDDDLRSFAEIDKIRVKNLNSFIALSDAWVRRKVSLIMQSGILDDINLDETTKIASSFDIKLFTENIDGNHVIVMPENKADLKIVLRFLDEDYFQSALSSRPHISNSKRLIKRSV